MIATGGSILRSGTPAAAGRDPALRDPGRLHSASKNPRFREAPAAAGAKRDPGYQSPCNSTSAGRRASLYFIIINSTGSIQLTTLAASGGTCSCSVVTSLTRCISTAAITRNTPPATTAKSRLLLRR